MALQKHMTQIFGDCIEHLTSDDGEEIDLLAGGLTDTVLTLKTMIAFGRSGGEWKWILRSQDEVTLQHEVLWNDIYDMGTAIQQYRRLEQTAACIKQHSFFRGIPKEQPI
uniref:Uncharacterized protein n=1 Tax=Cannabis sativa TaxID=3483 RepID=A0A803NUS7_CANSA